MDKSKVSRLFLTRTVHVMLQVCWKSMSRSWRRSTSLTYSRIFMLQWMVVVLMTLRWSSFSRWSFGCRFICLLNQLMVLSVVLVLSFEFHISTVIFISYHYSVLKLYFFIHLIYVAIMCLSFSMSHWAFECVLYCLSIHFVACWTLDTFGSAVVIFVI